jgi:hypothetical protein
MILYMAERNSNWWSSEFLVGYRPLRTSQLTPLLLLRSPSEAVRVQDLNCDAFLETL